MAEARSSTVNLPAIVDLDCLDPLRDELLDAIESGSAIVEADKVERVSTNALLMLLSAAETARRSQFSFSLTKASPAMLVAISKLGLTGHFAPILEGH